MAANAIYELQQSLSLLAGTGPSGPYLEAQAAANKWAGVSGYDLLAALNIKNGTYGINALGLNGVCNALANTSNLEAQDALSYLAGGGSTLG